MTLAVADPLSEQLALLATSDAYFAGLRAGGAWALRFPPPAGLKFNAVARGGCWLAVEGLDAPLRLSEGDCFLLTDASPFVLSSDPALPSVDAETVFRDAVGGIARCGSGEDLFLVGGRFAFGEDARLLLAGLPPVIHVRGDSAPASVLRWSLARLAEELARPAPGGALMREQLGRMMLVQVLRCYLADEPAPPAGWLAALSDPRIDAAVAAVHAEPARRWTVDGMAGVAGMSRSAFAEHFRRKAGMTPLAYVLRWRMQLAGRALRNGTDSVSTIAQALGYDADSAFSNAFKRVMGCSPRAYRAGARPA